MRWRVLQGNDVLAAAREWDWDVREPRRDTVVDVPDWVLVAMKTEADWEEQNVTPTARTP